jgi:hypothetical protein
MSQSRHKSKRPPIMLSQEQEKFGAPLKSDIPVKRSDHR